MSFVLNINFILPVLDGRTTSICRQSRASLAVVCSLSVVTKSQSEVTHNFAAGDMVEVCEGELIHLQGRVMRIDGNKITMLPKHEDLKVSDRISFMCAGVILVR